jgi:hypothetical protein
VLLLWLYVRSPWCFVLSYRCIFGSTMLLFVFRVILFQDGSKFALVCIMCHLLNMKYELVCTCTFFGHIYVHSMMLLSWNLHIVIAHCCECGNVLVVHIFTPWQFSFCSSYACVYIFIMGIN